MPEPSDDFAIIRVRAESRAEVPADCAHLRITVSGTGTTKARAIGALGRARSRLTRVLTRFDATVKHAQVVHTSVAPDRPHPGQVDTDGQPASWTARTTLSIDIGDVAGIGALYSALVKLSPEQLTGPAWALRSDHPAYAMVRREAVREAAARARQMAEAAGSHLIALEWLCDDEGHSAGRAAAVYAAAADPGELLPSEPAPQTVAVVVLAQYRIASVAYNRTDEGRTHA
jgi:hypothetical protein